MFSELSRTEIDVEVVLGDDSCQSSWACDDYFSKRVHESHDFERCTICTRAEEELDFSFHDQGLGSWGVLPRWTCVFVSQDCMTICFIHHWSQMWETIQALISSPSCFGT